MKKTSAFPILLLVIHFVACDKEQNSLMAPTLILPSINSYSLDTPPGSTLPMENTFGSRGITVTLCWNMGDYYNESGYLEAFISRDGATSAYPSHWTASPVGQGHGSGCGENYSGRVPVNNAVAETDETNHVVIVLFKETDECYNGPPSLSNDCVWDSRVVPAKYFWVHIPY